MGTVGVQRLAFAFDAQAFVQLQLFKSKQKSRGSEFKRVGKPSGLLSSEEVKRDALRTLF
jgi:hypothetical protein